MISLLFSFSNNNNGPDRNKNNSNGKSEKFKWDTDLSKRDGCCFEDFKITFFFSEQHPASCDSFFLCNYKSKVLLAFYGMLWVVTSVGLVAFFFSLTRHTK